MSGKFFGSEYFLDTFRFNFGSELLIIVKDVCSIKNTFRLVNLKDNGMIRVNAFKVG